MVISFNYFFKCSAVRLSHCVPVRAAAGKRISMLNSPTRGICRSRQPHPRPGPRPFPRSLPPCAPFWLAFDKPQGRAGVLRPVFCVLSPGHRNGGAADKVGPHSANRPHDGLDCFRQFSPRKQHGYTFRVRCIAFEQTDFTATKARDNRTQG